MDQFYILLIDYVRQLYYWKITENIQLCRLNILPLFKQQTMAQLNAGSFTYATTLMIFLP